MSDKPLLKKSDFQSDQAIRWCPGCGDYAILAQTQKVFPEITEKKEDTVFISVEGGNHTNFGMYELQSGDVPSTSTKKFQQDVVIDEIKKFILA